MTREEARLTLQENLGYLTSVHHQRILDAIKVAIEVLSEPSLPSNLDEAAIQAHIRLEDGEGLSFLNAFKAGAEWMARQGSSFKVNVEEVPQGHWYAGLHLGGCAEEEK